MQNAINKLVKESILILKKNLNWDNLSDNPNITWEIVKDNLEIILPRKEFELFHLLASKPGKVFKREEILDKVWGNEVIVGGRTIDVHIRKLREKIGEDLFKTIKGVGYKFEA